MRNKVPTRSISPELPSLHLERGGKTAEGAIQQEQGVEHRDGKFAEHRANQQLRRSLVRSSTLLILEDKAGIWWSFPMPSPL